MMRVRRFRLGDEPALFAVFRSSVHGLACRDYSPEQVRAWAPDDPRLLNWDQRIRGLAPFVVEDGGQAIAYADLRSDGYIDHFFVSGDHAGRGAGRLLMAALHESAARRGIASLRADVSLTAEPFFEHFGFRVEQRRIARVRGVALPNASMRKALAGSRAAAPVSGAARTPAGGAGRAP